MVSRDVTWITAAGPESQVDPVLGASASLRWPSGKTRGRRKLRLTANNANSMKQTMTIAPATSTPPTAWSTCASPSPRCSRTGPRPGAAAVLLRAADNITKGNAILYRDYNASAQPGVPWKQNVAGDTQYTDWQLVDIAPGSAQLTIGDQVELEVIAAGCSQGGHNGRIYVDGVGASIPGLFISGTGPASANQGSNVSYALPPNDGNGAANLRACGHTPQGTTSVVSAPG